MKLKSAFALMQIYVFAMWHITHVASLLSNGAEHAIGIMHDAVARRLRFS